MVLIVEKINKNIRDKKILQNISFKINSGECVALIGPNGAGKTTLFNIILGDKFASSGAVKINNLTVPNEKLKTQIAILNQENNIPANLKVKELIAFYQAIYEDHLSLKEIDSLLGFSQEQKNQLAGKLSGGQKRFLVFVLTLIGKPNILFLDEPTAAMDTSTRKRFWEIIDDLKEKGITIFYSSHYIEEVEHTAERILILNKGQLIKDTTPYALKAEKLEKQFIVPTKYEYLIKTLPNISDVIVKSDNISFYSKEANNTWELLSKNGLTIEDVEIQNRNLLESLFRTTEDK